MLNLTPDQRALGRENANNVIGSTRRDFLKAAAVAPGLGAFYFGYQAMGDKPPVRAAIIGTGNEGCGAMIQDHNRAYLDFVGFCDIRPSQQERALKQFAKHKDYSAADVAKLTPNTPTSTPCSRTTPRSRSSSSPCRSGSTPRWRSRR